MKIVSHSTDIASPLAAVWTRLLDWEDWPSWDGGMQFIQFAGPVTVGSIGRLRLKDGPTVDLHIANIVEGQTYTSYFDIVGTRFVFHHHIRSLTEKITQFEVVAEAEGPTAFILGNISRKKLVAGVPHWMATFKAKCQSLIV